SEEHTSELQSHLNLVCRLLLEKKREHSGGRGVRRSARRRTRFARRCAADQYVPYHVHTVCTPECLCVCLCLFFFNDTATTEIYTLSLHDALPISHTHTHTHTHTLTRKHTSTHTH